MFQKLPEELEKYIIKNYFHYSDLHYLSPVCKKWRDINNYITELKIFLTKTFECCITYPIGENIIDKIQTLELVGIKNFKRSWNNESLLNYKCEYLHAEDDRCNHLKYNTGRFNELDMMHASQINNKTMIQLTYYPSEFTFSTHFIDILKDMKKEINRLKKEYLKDKKNKGFKIKLHTRHNYVRGAMTLIIWR